MLERAGGEFELGGLALLDVLHGRIIHEVPMRDISSAGHTITHNPMHLEDVGGHLQLWVARDDHEVSAVQPGNCERSQASVRAA